MIGYQFGNPQSLPGKRGKGGIYHVPVYPSLDSAGYIVTEKLTFDGKYLFVNASVKEPLLEILDESGNVIEGVNGKTASLFPETAVRGRSFGKGKRICRKFAAEL